jgi:hypothetical protein
MTQTDTSVRTRKEIKQKLLKKAISEGRGAEMILLIQWRLEQVRHEFSQDKEILEESRMVDDGQPRSVRMLNTIARAKGLSKRFVETPGKHLFKGPDTLQ